STGLARHVLRRQGPQDALRDHLLRHVGHAERPQPNHRNPDYRTGLYRSGKIDLTVSLSESVYLVYPRQDKAAKSSRLQKLTYQKRSRPNQLNLSIGVSNYSKEICYTMIQEQRRDIRFK